MKLTVFSLLVITVIFAFAGVEPLSSYKDKVFHSTSSYLEQREAQRIAEAQQLAEQEEAKIRAQALAKVEGETLTRENARAKTEAETKAREDARAQEERTAMQEALKAERLAFELIDKERMLNGIMPTQWDDELYALSKLHTTAMSDRGELFHSPMDAPIGENAWGGAGYYMYSSDKLAKAMVEGWMSSPLHRAWILHKPIEHSVVTIVVTRNGQYSSWTFWTREVGEGPELVQKIADEWRRETSESIPWIEWLYMKGYLHKS